MKGLLRVFFFLFLISVTIDTAYSQDHQDQEVQSFLQRLFAVRIQSLTDRQYENLQPFYLPSDKRSRSAMVHEKNRSIYIHRWAEARGVKFVQSSGEIRVIRVKNMGELTQATVVQSLQLTYRYPDNELHTMGVGTRHLLTLKKQDGNWRVLKEWYLDPLDETPRLIPAFAPADKNVIEGGPAIQGRKRKYDREKAVRYANKYAGLANRPGTYQRYNQKYVDYTYQGGDCTNFTSQVLGDPEEGGGLPMRHEWRYKFNRGGSVAWVRTDSLKHFLIRSGYGTLIARGTYEQVAKPTKKFPRSALAELKPGDIIGYEMNGDVDHFSVVTARDSKGYVLVNSHTADRFQVPWDLGWDKHTKFLLFRIGE